MISLGIGDPDTPTPPLIVEAMQEAVSEPGTHKYPTNRGREEFREAVSDFYERRFDVKLDPDSEIMPAIGAKEAIFNLNLAFLDPGDYALAADPGYPVYTGGPLAGGRGAGADGARPELGFVPDLGAIDAETARRAKLMFLNYPNNPTGAVVPDGFFERVVEFARSQRDPGRARQLLFGDHLRRLPRALVSADAGRQGCRRRGVLAVEGLQHDRLALRVVVGNAAGDRDLLAAEDEHRLGLFEAVQLAGVAALSPDADAEVAAMNELYVRRRDLVCDALKESAWTSTRRTARSTCGRPCRRALPSSEAYCEHVLEQAAVVLSPGAPTDPAGRAGFRISLTTPGRRLLEAVERLGALGGRRIYTRTGDGTDPARTPARPLYRRLAPRGGPG